MTYCSEFAVFRVAKENQSRVVALSELLFAQMNAVREVLISHQILHKTDNAEEICWHLVWRDEAAVQENSKKCITLFKYTSNYINITVHFFYILFFSLIYNFDLMC